jgi:hypothetical protein
MGEVNKTTRKGQHNTPEHNARISASNKIAYSSPILKAMLSKRTKLLAETTDFRKIISMAQKGRIRTPEYLTLKSKQQKEYWRNHKHPCIGKIWTEEERRNSSLAHIGVQAGEKHPRWLGGLSLEPYGIGWTQCKKKLVKQRDNYTCQLCFANGDNARLDVHHIDYNKKHNAYDNWITLCHRCNGRVNLYREFWTSYFTLFLKLKTTLQLKSGTA